MRARKFLVERLRSEEEPLVWFEKQNFLVAKSADTAPRKEERKIYVFVSIKGEVVLNFPSIRSLPNLRMELHGLSAKITPLKMNVNKYIVQKLEVSLLIGNGVEKLYKLYKMGESAEKVEQLDLKSPYLPKITNGGKRKAFVTVSELEKEVTCLKKEEPDLLENRKFDTLQPKRKIEALGSTNNDLKSETNSSQIFHEVETGHLKEKSAIIQGENEGLQKAYIKISETFEELKAIVTHFNSIVYYKEQKTIRSSEGQN